MTRSDDAEKHGEPLDAPDERTEGAMGCCFRYAVGLFVVSAAGWMLAISVG